MRRVLINNATSGVFLGFDLADEPVWTADRQGPFRDYAMVFDDADDAQRLLRAVYGETPSGTEFRTVETTDPEFASVAECVKSGAPMWDVPAWGTC